MQKRIIDQRKRSLAKALTAILVEIFIDSIIISSLLNLLGLSAEVAIPSSLGIATFTEFICFITHYLNDRAWNRSQYGREVIEDEIKD